MIAGAAAAVRGKIIIIIRTGRGYAVDNMRESVANQICKMANSF